MKSSVSLLLFALLSTSSASLAMQDDQGEHPSSPRHPAPSPNEGASFDDLQPEELNDLLEHTAAHLRIHLIFNPPSLPAGEITARANAIREHVYPLLGNSHT